MASRLGVTLISSPLFTAPHKKALDFPFITSADFINLFFLQVRKPCSRRLGIRRKWMIIMAEASSDQTGKWASLVLPSPTNSRRSLPTTKVRPFYSIKRGTIRNMFQHNCSPSRGPRCDERGDGALGCAPSVVVEGDNLTVIKALQDKCEIPWEIRNVIREIQFMLGSFSSATCQHIFREENRAADYLSKGLWDYAIAIVGKLGST